MWNFHTELVVYMVGVVCMVGIDLPVVLLYRNRVMRNLDAADSAAIEHESRPGIVRLAVNSAAVLVGFVVWFALDSAAIASGARRDAFWWVLLGAFFSMWWLLAMPVIRKIDQALAQRAIVHHGAPAGAVRVASLRPRRVADYLPTTARTLPPVLAAAALIAIAVRALAYPPQEPRFLWGAILFAAFALFELILYALWIRGEVAGSYPLAGEGKSASEYEKEVERLRRFRVWAVYWPGLLMAAVFFCAAFLFLEAGRGALNEATGGLIGGLMGGIAGTAVGCWGAACGIKAFLHTARLNVLRSKIAGSSGDPCQGEAGNE